MDGNFVDYQVIRVRAGKGGNGCGAFDKSNNKTKGRPSGGSGGDGGDVVFHVDPSKNSLQHLQRSIRGGNGESGGQGNMIGARGEDAVVMLPPGTSVREIFPEEDGQKRIESHNSRLHRRMHQVDPIDGPNAIKHMQSALIQTAFDLDTPEAPPRVVCRGGRGGRGNISLGRSNGESESGQPGEQKVFELDLKTMADIGLVGLPNAGKSSFLAAVSNAHPKIAPYPFTTLNPYIGTILYPEARDGQETLHSITVADIPGLIEGAHQNIGLGHKFLKHVVKSRALAFVMDFSRPDPLADFQVLAHELNMYKPGLAARCRLVIANKADLLGEAGMEEVVGRVREGLPEGVQVAPISAMLRTGITEATSTMRQIVSENIKYLNT